MPSEPYGSNASGSSSSKKERPSNVAQPRTLEPLETPSLDKGKERAGSRYWSDLHSGKASPPPPLAFKEFSKPPSTRPTYLQSQTPVSSSSSINSFPPPPPPPPASSSLKRPNPFARDSPGPRPPPPPPSSSAWLPANPLPIPTSSPLHQFLDSLVSSSPSSPSTIDLARTLRKWARGVDDAPLTYFADPSQHWARKLSRRDLRKVLGLGGGGSAGGVGLGKAAKEELLARALKQERGATSTRTEEKEKRKMMYLVWKELEKGDRVSTRLNGGEVWEVLYEMVPEGFPFLEKTQGNKFALLSLDTSEERTVEEWFGVSPSQSSASRSSSVFSTSSRSRTSDVASVHSHKKRRVRRRESSSPPPEVPAPHQLPSEIPRTNARPSSSSSSSSSRLPQIPQPVASSSASSSSRPSSSSKVPHTPKRNLQTEPSRSASRNTRVVEEEDEDDQDLTNENSRAPWPSQRTDASFGLESNVSSSLARAADAAEEAFSKSSVKIDRSHRYPLGQSAPVSVEPSEEEQLNDPQPEDEDSDCIYYEPAPEPDEEEAMNSLDDAVGEDEYPEEEDGIEHEVEERALKDGEIEDDLEEGEIDDDDGEEAQLNDGLASTPEAEVIAGPIKRGRGRHFAPDVPPEFEPSNAPVLEEDDDDDEPIFLEIRPSPSKSSASATSQIHQTPIIVASPPEEEEEEEEEPSQQSQRIDASQEASSTQSSVGPEPPAFEGSADLTWAEDGGEPATVPATVRITRGDDSKHRLECQVLATGDAFSSSEEELRSAVLDETRRTITWTRSMFADQVSLSFHRPTPSLTNFDGTWDSFVQVHKSLFIGGSSQSKGKEREVIVLDDDEEENEVEVVEEVAKESVEEAMVLDGPWFESDRRSLLVDLSSFDLTSPERGNDFPRPSRCTIRVSVVQTTYGVGESVVEQRIHSSRLRHGPGALATLETPIAFEVDEAVFDLLDPSRLAFSGQLGLLPMSTLRLRVEYLSFNDSDGRPSKWILKALSSSRRDPAGSVRLPEAYFEISRPENLFGRWLEQQHPFRPAQQHDGVHLEGWNVGLTFRWNERPKDPRASKDGMGLEDDAEIEIDEPVVKRSTIQTVSESPSRREERAVEEAMGIFEEEMGVVEEDQSRKRKARDLTELLERPSSVRRLSVQPPQDCIPSPPPQPSLPSTSTSTNLLANSNPLSDPVVPPPCLDDSTSPSPVRESTSLAQETLDYQYDEIPSSDDEIELDEPAGQQDLPMDDSTRLASPPLAPAVVIQPPSSLVAPPSQEQADDEHLSEKGTEASSPSSRERSVSVRASSLLTDAPVDERMDALAQEHRSHRASSSRLPSSSLSAELLLDTGTLDPPLPSTSSSTITPLPLALSSSSSPGGPVPRPPQENALAGPSNWRKPSAAAAMIDRTKAKRNPFLQLPPPPSQGPKPKQQVYIISSDEDDDDDDELDEPSQPAPPSKRPSQPSKLSNIPQPTPYPSACRPGPSHSQPARFWETNPPLPPPKPQAPPSETPRLASSVFKPSPATSKALEQSNREPQPPSSSSSSTPKLKPAQPSRPPSYLQIPIPPVLTPNHLTAGHIKTFLSNSSAGTSAPSLLRGNSASSASSSSNAVPDASTSCQALFEALTDAQREHTLKINPQRVEETTFPRVVSKGRTKATSQRVVGGVFADLLWRLEKISGDESYRMRERDEAIFDIEGLQDGQKILMCCWNRWVEKNSLDRIHQKNAPSYTIGFVNKYFRVLDDLHLYPFFVVLLTTLRTFELIDTKALAAALAKWASLRRERVAKKLEEKTNGGGSKPKGVEGRKVVTVVRLRGDRG